MTCESKSHAMCHDKDFRGVNKGVRAEADGVRKSRTTEERINLAQLKSSALKPSALKNTLTT